MDRKGLPPRYHAYMLRMWEERSEGDAQRALWRFQVEDPHTGRRRSFDSFSTLFTYLQGVVAYEGEGGLDWDHDTTEERTSK